ncbi:hypothetical protein EJB05_48208 [Eragrostis curvula]|uniref:Uncharacterized protein n=1 Tax=Eragrostis curvula TaxID=38414 RepID=A0A5J9T187_9POAL|nr:hypothetical protein EJB05_48200 [Eragrostis curvula]TVU05060.1 hypothetical protein EJB05_48208 [Eragrostis curvula]
MSTAVAPGMPPAHGGFQRPGKGKADPDERKRDTNGFLSEEEEEEDAVVRRGQEEEEEAALLSDSSSIGAASSDSSSIGENSASEKEDGEEDEVESKAKEVEGLGMMGLGTLESLEDALPTKRGLSNFYAGKSKSFTSLGEAAAKAAAKEIAKPENPFNKRRRVLAAWSRRRASCSALATTYLPPLLAPDHAVLEEDDEEGADNSDDEECGKSRRERRQQAFPSPRLSVHTQMLRNPNPSSFRSPRSFSMTDLQSASYNLAEN